MRRKNRKYTDYHRMNENGLEEKQCIDCHQWFLMTKDNYGSNKNNKDKFNEKCRSCQKKNNKLVYESDKERYKTASRERGRRNKEEKNKKDLEYYYDSKEKRKKAVLSYRASHKQQQADSTKRWRQYPTSKPHLRRYTLERSKKEHEITTKEWTACKKYFNNSCAYCELKAEDHFKRYNGILRPQELHKEHVDDKGSNGISNCVPSCHTCNSEKHTYLMDEWYKQQESFTEERYNKILRWITEGYKESVEEKPPYRITKRRNEHDNKFHWQLWTIDEERNMIKCVDIKDKKKDLDLSLISCTN